MTVMATMASFYTDTSQLMRIGLFIVVVLWLATAFWTFKDARRRVEQTWLVGLATLLGLIPPFLGPIIYLFFRPPEYLQDVHERQLEIQAMEERLAQLDHRCPVCRAKIDQAYLVCPVCTTRLKQACGSCGKPLDALWQVCPYCATPVPPVFPSLGDVSTAPRRPSRRAKASD
jgi:hypothetical protein